MSKSNNFNEENSNHSCNPTFDSILEQRVMSRRGFLGMSLSGAAVVGGMGLGLTGCSLSDSDDVVTAPVSPTTPPTPLNPVLAALGFTAVGKSLLDKVVIPTGYSAQIIYALGDPLTAATPAYKNDGTDGDFDNRAGDHHDGMEYFGLDAAGKPSVSAADRALLAMNHEATTDSKLSSHFIHANGGTTTLPRPAAEVDKEVAIHGLSVVEVKVADKKWATVQSSAFNRRVTPLTPVEIAGPARGNALLITKYSADATKTRGTINNCGTGKTPWGTFLSGEENWAGYFFRVASDDTARANDKSVTSLKRYGRNAGSSSRHGWETGGTLDQYARWNISKTGASTNGSDDYRNELNGQGYIIEMDAYDKTKALKKRSALGRFAHESAAFGIPAVGKPLTVYMGDDSRNEYMYKFVSKALWVAADANPADRMATGDKYLDEGTLYVAKFNADGTGEWVELSMSNAKIAAFAGYKFADLADICVNTRLAGDAVGATKMDRPEWGGVNPVTGEFYQTLTNNSNRNVDATGSSQLLPDNANPRAYADVDGVKGTGNPNGHILRTKEGATVGAFIWDVYLFGAEADADKGLINLSNLTDDQDFSSPDGLAFSPNTGICWIQTDDGAYTDVTNCMMLAAIPGKVGDGAAKTLSHTKKDGTKLDVVTQVGAAPAADKLKRFLVGPKDCEITGLCETPDGKAIFINIQHPGEGTALANIADPTKYTSQWPANAGYGAGKRPRSATIVITKNDGGRIGS
ncbi:PhoX family protein [Janthinobacterium sp. B9-8]|uniref:PhoX family protein n=1 Tax=Janthinobacterium sp. B9-8 TaxID=1236179 RepID=UPI00061CEC40|nr:PhoX family phosphatase [Janthinobacterium sp. B9-8]AMC35072.1 phosphatase [Janthinobacterium sp. B9-8]